MIGLPLAPFPVTYRELWLPPGINENASLPTSIQRGHGLTFTGARRGTTADGVHFNGAVTSNINCGAIHDNAATYWVSFRFKLDQLFSAAAATDQYLWGKHVDATHFVWLVLRAADGKLYFEGDDAVGGIFSIAAQDGAADITTWNAGQWYHVLASISAANDVRFIIDDGTVVTVVTAIAFPNGGDFIIGDYDDPGAGTGFEGVIADFFGSTIDNTVAEEADLYKGIPPADVVNGWLLDEGRGVTAYDRGTGADNGTLDTSATWAFGQVQQPVISFDCINDVATSSVGVDFSGDVSVIWAGKIKSTYVQPTERSLFLSRLIVGADYAMLYHTAATDGLRWFVNGSGSPAFVDAPIQAIDDYKVIIGTLTAGGVIKLFINGVLIGVDTGVGLVTVGGAIAYLGNNEAPAGYDGSKPLFAALIDGAFTNKQALAYSRYLKNIFNLPISI